MRRNRRAPLLWVYALGTWRMVKHRTRRLLLPAGSESAKRGLCVTWELLSRSSLHVAGEDRTHDLRIMRPTRCQLRYCHDENFAKLGASSRMRPARSCAASISTRFWQVTQTAEPLFIRSKPQRMGAQGLPAVVPRWPLEVCTPYLQSEPTQSRMQCQLDASLPIIPLPLLCGR